MLLGQILDLAASHPDAWVYAYGSYEAAFLRRVGKTSWGTRGDTAEDEVFVTSVVDAFVARR